MNSLRGRACRIRDNTDAAGPWEQAQAVTRDRLGRAGLVWQRTGDEYPRSVFGRMGIRKRFKAGKRMDWVLLQKECSTCDGWSRRIQKFLAPASKQGPGFSGSFSQGSKLPNFENNVGMQYRLEATSVTGFVQQLACHYLPHGYRWYVTGLIPEHKNPAKTDEKILTTYGIARSKRQRARNKELGQANLHYLRFERFFVILASEGRHEFFEREGDRIRDIRRVPIRFWGYSISYRRGGKTRSGEVDSGWHSHVQIDRERYKEERAYLLERSLRLPAEELAGELRGLPFEPYAPVRRQMLLLLRAVNAKRKTAGLDQLPSEVLRLRRRVVKPFEPPAAHQLRMVFNAENLPSPLQKVVGD